jgi:hypothetical protein
MFIGGALLAGGDVDGGAALRGRIGGPDTVGGAAANSFEFGSPADRCTKSVRTGPPSPSNSGFVASECNTALMLP